MVEAILFAAGYVLAGLCVGTAGTVALRHYRHRRILQQHYVQLRVSKPGGSDTTAVGGYRTSDAVAITANPQIGLLVIGTTNSAPVALDVEQAYQLGQILDRWVSQRRLHDKGDSNDEVA